MPSKRPSTSSQAGPSVRRRREGSASSDDAPRATQTATQTQGGGRIAITASQVQQCAAKLVRLALFHEYQHKVLRRDIISTKVLPSNAKGAFNTVMERAQLILRTKFGMELYELRGKAKGAAMGDETQATQVAQTQRRGRRGKRLDRIEEDEEDEDEDADEGAATQTIKTIGSKTYIVRSILSPEIRALMATPQPLPMFDAAGDRAQEDDHVDSGAMVAWDKADGTGSGNVQMLGIRTVILCLVLCMGRIVSDDNLHSMLKRLNLLRETVLPFSSPDSKEPHMTLDKYLDLLARQQYLEKVKLPGQTHGGEETPAYEWRWGNREAEFTEQAAADWVIEILNGDAGAEDDDDDDDEADGDDQGGRSGRDRRKKKQEARAKRLETLKMDIVRAAGGPLTSD